MTEMCFKELAPDDKDEFKEMGNLIKEKDRQRKLARWREENKSTPAAPKRARNARKRPAPYDLGRFFTRNQRRRRGMPGPGNDAGSNLHLIFLY